jgi:hypothetical protein
MIPLFTDSELQTAKTNDLLRCQCHQCSNEFFTKKREIMYSLRGKKDTAKFCSKKCRILSDVNKIKISCTNCNIEFERIPSEIGKNNFCCQRCAGIYNSKHKIKGTRRSKLEKWIEEQLKILYPNLIVDYNKTNAIGCELDIFVPSLNVAFELNGIFHYEPIYGVNKLEKIRKNDFSKSKLCHESKIDLCVIDTSSQKYVKPSTSEKFLKIITDVINERLKDIRPY